MTNDDDDDIIVPEDKEAEGTEDGGCDGGQDDGVWVPRDQLPPSAKTVLMYSVMIVFSAHL